jgi:hypothetical protein
LISQIKSLEEEAHNVQKSHQHDIATIRREADDIVKSLKEENQRQHAEMDSWSQRFNGLYAEHKAREEHSERELKDKNVIFFISRSHLYRDV